MQSQSPMPATGLDNYLASLYKDKMVTPITAAIKWTKQSKEIFIINAKFRQEDNYLRVCIVLCQNDNLFWLAKDKYDQVIETEEYNALVGKFTNKVYGYPLMSDYKLALMLEEIKIC